MENGKKFNIIGADKKTILDYLIALGVVAIISIISKWIATAIVLMTKGTIDMMSGDITSSVEIRLNMTYVISFLVSCILFFAYVSVRRDRFTWGDAESEWDSQKKQFCFRHMIVYFVYSLPVNLCFMIYGCDAIYNRKLFTPGMMIDKTSIAEPWWIANFFGPQAAFFRLTKSVVLGVLLNLIIFEFIIWLSCYRKKKN